MRVLVMAPVPETPGGVASYFRVLRPHLGDNIVYLPVGSRSGGPHEGATITRMARDYWNLLLALCRGRYDVVHINPSLVPKSLVRDGLSLVLAKLFDKKVVVFTHGWDHAFEKRLRARFLPLFRHVYFRADAMVVLAQEFRDRLLSMGYNGPVFLEVAAVEDDLVSTEPGPARPHEDSFNVLFLARVEREKGPFEMVDAFRILKNSYPGARLTFAGDGPDFEAVRRHASGTEGIEFLGHVPPEKRQAVFSAADVYVLPSYAEGLPLSVLEAMASGLPVITTPVGGIRDFFENGRMGFLTAPREPNDLANQLARLMNSPELRTQIGAYNRRYAAEHFAPAHLARRLLHIYESVAYSAA